MVVDLALVLAVDCSSSVDVGDFRLQMDGIAAALRNPPLFEAIAAGSCQQIAMTLVLWSSRDSQAIAIAWRVLSSRLELEAMAQELKMPSGAGDQVELDSRRQSTSAFLSCRRCPSPPADV
jgi:uncharacterized protein DUF1194